MAHPDGEYDSVHSVISRALYPQKRIEKVRKGINWEKIPGVCRGLFAPSCHMP